MSAVPKAGVLHAGQVWAKDVGLPLQADQHGRHPCRQSASSGHAKAMTRRVIWIACVVPFELPGDDPHSHFEG
jgi:hypothetical protein